MKRTMKKKQNHHKYRCGICDEEFERSEVVRDEGSDTGWICRECRAMIHPEYEEDSE